MAASEGNSNVALPRVAIRFCTQCKWMLRAAYFAQELLSTFSTSLGEVALIPSSGGVFTIEITHLGSSSLSSSEALTSKQLWDRKANGGFPEVKHLKQLVRDVIDPDRDLGHVDRHSKGTDGDDMRTDRGTRLPSKPEGNDTAETTEDIEKMDRIQDTNKASQERPASTVNRGGPTTGSISDDKRQDDCEECC